MNFRQSFKIAAKSIAAKKGRSILTMLGIIIGLAAVIALVSFTQGQNKWLNDYYAQMGDNIININATTWDGRDISEQLYTYCQKMDEYMLGVTPNYQCWGELNVRYGTKSLSSYNTDWENQPQVYLGNQQFTLCLNYELEDGRDLAYIDVKNMNHVCILGSRIAKNLFDYAQPVGQRISINGTAYTVIGIYKECDPENVGNGKDNVILLPYTLKKLFGDRVDGGSFVGKAKDAASVPKAIGLLNGYLPGLVGDSGWGNASTPNTWQQSANEQNKMQSLFLGGIAALSYVFNAVTLIYVAAYRSMERPQLGMYILAASMVANTFLNWVLIFGKLGFDPMGVKGAAVATLISRVLEVAIVLVHMVRTRAFRIRPGLLLRPGGDMARRFFKYGGLVVCNETMWGLGTSVFPTIMGHMENSTEILAAYTISGNVEKIFMVAAFGLASTAAVLVGREVGAGRTDGVQDLGLTLNTLAVLCGLVVGTILFLFTWFVAPRWVFPLFHLSETGASASTVMLTLIAVTMPLRDFNNVNIVGVLRGGGDVRAATMIDLGPLWLAAIPYAVVCGVVLRTGIFWVYLAFTVDYTIKFFLGVWRLRSGKWVKDLTRS